ncbi:hypothetical protein R6Q59_019148 [Mikania micrantha]
MEIKLEETRVSFYSLFIFIIIFISSLSLPFQFQSFCSSFTKFLDTNDRHCLFLLCNGILCFLFFSMNKKCNETLVFSVDDLSYPLNTHDQVQDLKTEPVLDVQKNHDQSAMEMKQIEQSESGMLVCATDDDDHHHHHHHHHLHDQIEDQVTEVVDDLDDPLNTHDQVQDLKTELVLDVQKKHDQSAMEMKQIEQSGMLVGATDDDDHHLHDQIEDPVTEVVEDVDYEHKIGAISEVEDEEHDDEDEFRQKCDEFIEKVKRSMRNEGTSLN